MKTDLLKSNGRWQLAFWCPGCQTHHGVPVHLETEGGEGWRWNGDRIHPTLTPSLLTKGTVPLTGAQLDELKTGGIVEPVIRICHLFLTDGVVNYLADSTHDLAGRSIPIEDLP